MEMESSSEKVSDFSSISPPDEPGSSTYWTMKGSSLRKEFTVQNRDPGSRFWCKILVL